MMNTNLLKALKQITAQYGEDILGDASRLKAPLREMAKDEPKEDRIAFGRAVEQGFYRELKGTAAADRPRIKALLIPRLQTATGFDAVRCAAALDLLDAAIVPAPEKRRFKKQWIAAGAVPVIAIAAYSALAKERSFGVSGQNRETSTANAAPSPRAPQDIPRYALEEAERYRTRFLSENTAAAADLTYRFFYNEAGEACLEYTVTSRGRYIWSNPTWIGSIWGNSKGFLEEGVTHYTITKQKKDEAERRMEARRQDPVFAEIEKTIVQIAAGYDYDFFAAYGRVVKYRDPNVKKAVCEGYSRAVVQALQNHALVRDVETWTSVRGNHAWNVIVLHDRRKLYCDATWYDGSSVDDEGYVVHEPVCNPVDLTFDLNEFNTMGGAADAFSHRPVAVHFDWRDAKRK